MEPTGWSVHAAEQAEWTRLREYRMTQMVLNFKLNPRNTRAEVVLGLERLHGAGHMTNISLQ